MARLGRNWLVGSPALLAVTRQLQASIGVTDAAPASQSTTPVYVWWGIAAITVVVIALVVYWLTRSFYRRIAWTGLGLISASLVPKILLELDVPGLAQFRGFIDPGES